jgi:hypothetical protein
VKSLWALLGNLGQEVKRHLGVSTTARNWRTAGKVMEMVE